MVTKPKHLKCHSQELDKQSEGCRNKGKIYRCHLPWDITTKALPLHAPATEVM